MSNAMIPRDADAFFAALQGLLPRGFAWSRALGSRLSGLLFASAGELARVDAAARLLADEILPLTTVQGLEDWERVLGLPDQCLPAGATLQERRDAVLSKLRDTGRQDLDYWYDLAASLGYEVTIEEHWPFCCDWHQCGDPQGGWTPESGMGVERWEQDMGCAMGRCGPPEMRYWWRVVVHGERLILFRCGESACPELLLDWRRADSLECVMRRDREAHTLITFDYREE